MHNLIEFIKTYFDAGAPCLFHQITGLYCPGCGGRRAVYYLLHGQFLLSVVYHPLVMYCAVLLAYLIIRHLWLHIHTRTLSPAIAPTISNPPDETVRRGFKSSHAEKTPPLSFVRPWMLWGMLAVILANFAIKNIALIVFHMDLLP